MVPKKRIAAIAHKIADTLSVGRTFPNHLRNMRTYMAAEKIAEILEYEFQDEHPVLTEGKVCKGGQNPPDQITARPDPPQGSSGVENNPQDRTKCPYCDGKIIGSCRCFRQDSECENGHTWHYCTQHHCPVPGKSDHSIDMGVCTCSVPIGLTVKLKTLDEHNKEILDSCYIETKNGIACPLCGSELVDVGKNRVLTTWPMQLAVKCPQCGFHDFRYELH